MKFSIIIPVYNVEQYIEECVESILNQTYQDFEIILVDDGSTDRSGKICDAYAEKDCRITVIHNQNQGQFASRMCGVQKAFGDIIWFVDSDDCIRNDALELLQGVFRENVCDLIIFEGSRDADYIKPMAQLPFYDGQCFADSTKSLLYEKIIETSKLNSVALKAVKKEILDTVPQKYFNFKGRNAEDLLLTIPLISTAAKIVYFNQNLYYYRQRPGSTVHTYNPKKYRSIKKVHMEMEKYIDLWGMGHLHAKHYAREVRGWVDCLKQMLLIKKAVSPDLLRELAEDEYFIKAYRNMDSGALSKIEKTLSKWLYKKKYTLIKLAGAALRAASKLKRKLKR